MLPHCSVRNKDQKLVAHFLKIGFFRLLIGSDCCCPIEVVHEIQPTKMDFGRPNAKIGWKMANSQLISSTALEIIMDKRQEVCSSVKVLVPARGIQKLPCVLFIV